MLDEDKPAKIRAATADQIGYVHGMLITFEELLHRLSEHDLLIVTAADGSPIYLQGVKMEGDTLVVAATVNGLVPQQAEPLLGRALNYLALDKPREAAAGPAISLSVSCFEGQMTVWISHRKPHK